MGVKSQRNPTSRRACQLHLVADDFGRSSEINHAIVQAHHYGTITGASLMMGGAACAHAVRLARRTPSLAVGLHLVVAGGRSCLSAEKLPNLVDPGGEFPASPAVAGWRYALLPAAREQLRRELRAQFERFADTGLRLAHVDGHMHLHLHPTVFRLLLPLLVEYHVPRVRLPRDELWRALAWDHRRAVQKAALAAVFGLLSYRAARRLKRLGIATTERTYGLFQSGNMAEPYVTQLLHDVHGQSAEIYFHPTTGTRLDALGPNPGDLATLLSPRVRQLVAEVRQGRDEERTDDQPRNAAQGALQCSYKACC
ncbi:MAG TPA: hopanoid biosynthesis-associated protein HpnK [Pirellulales bacterium]